MPRHAKPSQAKPSQASQAGRSASVRGHTKYNTALAPRVLLSRTTAGTPRAAGATKASLPWRMRVAMGHSSASSLMPAPSSLYPPSTVRTRYAARDTISPLEAEPKASTRGRFSTRCRSWSSSANHPPLAWRACNRSATNLPGSIGGGGTCAPNSMSCAEWRKGPRANVLGQSARQGADDTTTPMACAGARQLIFHRSYYRPPPGDPPLHLHNERRVERPRFQSNEKPLQHNTRCADYNC
jgi:hypothetical protein